VEKAKELHPIRVVFLAAKKRGRTGGRAGGRKEGREGGREGRKQKGDKAKYMKSKKCDERKQKRKRRRDTRRGRGREGGKERGRKNVPNVLGDPKESIAVGDGAVCEGGKEGIPVGLEAAKGGVDGEAGGREEKREGGRQGDRVGSGWKQWRWAIWQTEGRCSRERVKTVLKGRREGGREGGREGERDPVPEGDRVERRERAGGGRRSSMSKRHQRVCIS
jgi:hypothetical protein